MKRFAILCIALLLNSLIHERGSAYGLIPMTGYRPGLTLLAPSHWPVGYYSRVDITISPLSGRGPARLFHEIPPGFDVAPLDIAGADIYIENGALNIVWTEVGPSDGFTVSYYLKPPDNAGREISFTAAMHIVASGGVRTTLYSEPLSFTTGGGTGYTLAEVMAAREALERPFRTVMVTPRLASGSDDPLRHEREASSSGIVFRVQVSSSSTLITEWELRELLSLDSTIRVTVTSADDIYRYQVGEYRRYSEAEKAASGLQRQGVEGAFVVAYRGNSRISLSEARRLVDDDNR